MAHLLSGLQSLLAAAEPRTSCAADQRTRQDPPSRQQHWLARKLLQPVDQQKDRRAASFGQMLGTPTSEPDGHKKHRIQSIRHSNRCTILISSAAMHVTALCAAASALLEVQYSSRVRPCIPSCPLNTLSLRLVGGVDYCLACRVAHQLSQHTHAHNAPAQHNRSSST